MDHDKEDGHHEPFPSDVAKPDNSNIHPSPSEAMSDLPNTVTIPCHHISLGDFLMLNGRPCQVIRISTSSATGQYRYLGVDVFTKQLHEESSFTSNPAPSVIVQTMLGPIFKQYRVLNILEGQIIVMTETGDVKHGLPVIDQSNLYARLSQAFEAGPGSVRVLVLNDGGRELAVDMKVIHGSRGADDQTEQTFRDAVRRNDILAVEKALQGRVNINMPDYDGKTALVDAIENHYYDMVGLLLQQEIDLKALDKNRKTVLDIAVSDPEHYLTTFKLLKKGAASTDNLDEGIAELLSAATKGQHGEIKALLSGGVNHNSCDRLGYTALHEAVCFGHYETARMLIRDGADINKTIAHGGATVLHAAVQRGREHREFLPGARRTTPALSENHVKVVALLLQHNADTQHRRSYDNLTVRELVSDELGSAENFRAVERSCLQKILILLNNSLPQQVIGIRETWPAEPSVSNRLKASRLQIQWHTSSRVFETLSPSVWDLMQSPEPSHTRSEVRRLEEWVKGGVNNSKPREYWRWAHLPANNVCH